jgi:hypothetical protein
MRAFVMGVICDICKGEVTAGIRFCPHCGLEIVPERERASRPPPMETDVFDWEAGPGQTKPYDFASQQVPGLDAERTKELLDLAEARFQSGEVLDATALLKQVRPQLARHAALRGTFGRLFESIEARKQATRQRCEALAEARDSDRLLALLAGQAANELEPEEVCEVALAHARVFYQARRANAAAELLRLAPFRTLRHEQMVREHRELELQVHRMRARQHALKSFAVIGSAVAIGAMVLLLFAIVVWHGGTTLALWLLIPTAVIAVIVGSNVRHIRRWRHSSIDLATHEPESSHPAVRSLRERRR